MDFRAELSGTGSRRHFQRTARDKQRGRRRCGRFVDTHLGSCAKIPFSPGPMAAGGDLSSKTVKRPFRCFLIPPTFRLRRCSKRIWVPFETSLPRCAGAFGAMAGDWPLRSRLGRVWPVGHGAQANEQLSLVPTNHRDRRIGARHDDRGVFLPGGGHAHSAARRLHKFRAAMPLGSNCSPRMWHSSRRRSPDMGGGKVPGVRRHHAAQRWNESNASRIVLLIDFLRKGARFHSDVPPDVAKMIDDLDSPDGPKSK